MPKTALAALALAAICVAPLPVRADASPSPAATPHVRMRATAKPLRSGVNLCQSAQLYVWPAEGGLPNPANAPPANLGERFQIQKGPRYTSAGKGYYETTIPLPANVGRGYYWVSQHCFTVS
jgi:hypothetical protein